MWPQIRAVLITLHIVAITLLAIPAPDGGLDRKAWNNPTVQAELKEWTENLNACGIDLSQQELEDQLWRGSHAYMEVRNEVLGPFLPYYIYCGTFQAWRMFVAPHRYPTALHIEIAEHGVWRPVYVERDPRHGWLGRQLDSHRFRSVVFRFGWPGYEGEFDRFAHWVAHRAAADFPEAQRVRIRLVKSRTRSPQEVRAGQAPETEVVQSIELPLRGEP